MKKKNLLKCLALTSMLALSVGAVTSCGTAQQGAQGPAGATGATGAQGDKGDKGDKGDTSYEVIVLPSTGGKITSDMYTGIAGDTPVLTFTPTTAGQVVIGLTINYEEVELTDEILNGSLKLTFADQSFIVSATFGTAVTYGTSLIQKYYNALAGADDQLNFGYDKTAFEVGRVAGSYADVSLKALAGNSVLDLTAKIDALPSTTSVKDKIAKVKELVATYEAAIDKKYGELIAAAKTSALAEAKVLYNDGKALSKTDPFTATDRTAFYTELQGKINSAKTLHEISSYIDSSKITTVKAQYDVMEEQRAYAQKQITDYITALETKDSAFKSSNKAAHKVLVDTLAEYGITELPEDVATKQLAKLSSASTWTVTTSKTDDAKTTDEGVAALKVVTDSFDNIVVSLKSAIRAMYDKEINASTIVTEIGDRQNISNIVGTAITNWLSVNKSTYTISDMLSYDDEVTAVTATAAVGTVSTDTTVNTSKTYYTSDGLTTGTPGKLVNASGATFTKVASPTGNPSTSSYYELSVIGTDAVAHHIQGLLGNIETQLVAAVNVSFVPAAFTAERMANAKASVITDLESSVSKIITSDSVYASYIADQSTTSTPVYLTEIGPEGHEVTLTLGGNASYDVNAKFDVLVPSDKVGASGNIYDSALNTVLSIKKFGADQAETLVTVYDDAITAYSNAQKTAQITEDVELSAAVAAVACVGAASTDTEVDTSKTYYTKAAGSATPGKLVDSEGATYTKVSSPSGNPSTSSYYEVSVEGSNAVDAVKSTNFTTTVLGEYWDGYVADVLDANDTVSATDINKLVSLSDTWYKLLPIAENGYNTWKTAAVAADANLNAKLIAGNSIYESFLGEKGIAAQIIDGSISSESGVNTWVDSLSTLYTAAVTSYKQDVLDAAKEVYNNLIATAAADKVGFIKNAYSAWVAALGNKAAASTGHTAYDYTKATFTNYDTWLAAFKAAVTITQFKGPDGVDYGA